MRLRNPWLPRRLLICAITVACSVENLADWNEPGVLSPDGTAKARLMHLPGSTSSQVYITFDRGACGAGSVSAPGAAPDIKLTWRSSRTLEVVAPREVRLMPAPASRGLDHRVKCRNRVVDVVVVRR